MPVVLVNVTTPAPRAMAPAHPGTSSDGDVILNRLNVALAKRQGLLASLVGVASKDEPKQKPLPEIQRQEDDGFSADPELLGIGGKIPDDDQVDRLKMSSNHELKRQLLGRDYEKRQRAKRDLNLSQQAIPMPRTATDRKGPHSQISQKVETDSEEDAGRSSLGKRKRNRPLQAEKRAAMNEGADEGADEDKGQALSNSSGRPEALTLASFPRSQDDLDEVLAVKCVRKRKRKNKKKHQGVQ